MTPTIPLGAVVIERTRPGRRDRRRRRRDRPDAERCRDHASRRPLSARSRRLDLSRDARRRQRRPGSSRRPGQLGLGRRSPSPCRWSGSCLPTWPCRAAWPRSCLMLAALMLAIWCAGGRATASPPERRRPRRARTWSMASRPRAVATLASALIVAGLISAPASDDARSLHRRGHARAPTACRRPRHSRASTRSRRPSPRRSSPRPASTTRGSSSRRAPTVVYANATDAGAGPSRDRHDQGERERHHHRVERRSRSWPARTPSKA